MCYRPFDQFYFLGQLYPHLAELDRSVFMHICYRNA